MSDLPLTRMRSRPVIPLPIPQKKAGINAAEMKATVFSLSLALDLFRFVYPPPPLLKKAEISGADLKAMVFSLSPSRERAGVRGQPAGKAGPGLFLWLVILLTLLCTSQAALASPASPNPHAPPDTPTGYPLRKTIQYSFTMQNTTNHIIPAAEFRTYAPVKQTAFQRTLSLETSHPHDLVTDRLGNQILHFLFSDLPPFATKHISVKAQLAFSPTPNPLAADNLGDYLAPAPFIEADDPQIIALATSLRSGSPTATAQKTFSWVADNIRYTGYGAEERGALQALTSRTGDCTEFADLMAALLRANNIPARVIAGYVTQNGSLKPAAFHNWVEFRDNTRWQIADPQQKLLGEKQANYVAMRIIGPAADNPMGESSRFRVEGEGVTVTMDM